MGGSVPLSQSRGERESLVVGGTHLDAHLGLEGGEGGAREDDQRSIMPAEGGAPPTTSVPKLVVKRPRVSGGDGICSASFVFEQGRRQVTWQHKHVNPYPVFILSTGTQQSIGPHSPRPQGVRQPVHMLAHVRSPFSKQHSGHKPFMHDLQALKGHSKQALKMTHGNWQMRTINSKKPHTQCTTPHTHFSVS